MTKLKVACLAWGSLLWKTGPLRVQGEWQDDGPWLPVEFARVGDRGELATVLCDRTPAVRTWWALVDAHDVEDAREQLRQREEISPDHPEWIGSLPHAQPQFLDREITEWMTERHLDGVVWTALPPRYADTEYRRPSAVEAAAYLIDLLGEKAAHAEDYIRRVPRSIATPHRDFIQTILGWTPQ